MRVTVKEALAAIPMVKVIYSPTNTAKHPLHGTVKVLNGRSISYGFRKQGDVFNVAVVDIAAHPNNYRAYPCNEPFGWDEGGNIIMPCPDTLEETMVADNLEELPGVGPRVAERLVSAGLVTKEDVANRATDELMSDIGVPPASRKKILEWQQSRS